MLRSPFQICAVVDTAVPWKVDGDIFRFNIHDLVDDAELCCLRDLIPDMAQRDARGLFLNDVFRTYWVRCFARPCVDMRDRHAQNIAELYKLARTREAAVRRLAYETARGNLRGCGEKGWPSIWIRESRHELLACVHRQDEGFVMLAFDAFDKLYA